MSTATASLTNAAESLLVDLANGCIGTSLPLDATQQELSMSRPLVYMAGLIVVVAGSGGPSSPPFTKEQHSLFQRLQTLYHEGRGQETLYELSPTLLPCEAARKEIQQAVEKRVKEIEEQSSKVAKELLKAEQKAKKTKNKKTTTNKKKENPARTTNITSPEKEDALKDDEHTIPRPSASESESLTALFLRQLPLTSSDEDADESGSWMEVTKKSKKPVVAAAAARTISTIPSVEESKSSEEEEEEKKLPPKSFAPSLPTLKQAKLPARARMKLVKKPLVPALQQQQQQQQQHVEEKVVEAKKEPPENKTEPKTSPLTLPVVNHTPTDVYTVNDPTCSTTLLQWQARIRQLESQLSQKNQDLEEERTAHTKALALEKEISNERLQALQLRLYISETRLKTFEDALEQHVQAVANNTAPASPERRRLRPEEQVTTPPLLSRVQELNREC
jgi:hypothetical protein